MKKLDLSPIKLPGLEPIKTTGIAGKPIEEKPMP